MRSMAHCLLIGNVIWKMLGGGGGSYVWSQILWFTKLLSSPLGTTRRAQEGERHGVDYNFISVEEFKRMEKNGSLLESGVYEGNYYGTPKPTSDPPSSIPHYARSPANSGYSRGALIPSGSLSPPSRAGRGSVSSGYPPAYQIPKQLGPLPPNWEIAYTENNEKYFIE